MTLVGKWKKGSKRKWKRVQRERSEQERNCKWRDGRVELLDVGTLGGENESGNGRSKESPVMEPLAICDSVFCLFHLSSDKLII